MRKRIILTAILTFMFGLFFVPLVPTKASELFELDVTISDGSHTLFSTTYDLSGSKIETFVLTPPDNYKFAFDSYPVLTADGGFTIGYLKWDEWSGGLVYVGDTDYPWVHCTIQVESTITQSASLVRVKLNGDSGNFIVCNTFYSAPTHLQADIGYFDQLVSGNKQFYVVSYETINATVNRVYCAGEMLYVDVASMSGIAYIDVVVDYTIWRPDATPTPTPTPLPGYSNYYLYITGDDNRCVLGTDSSVGDYKVRYQLWRTQYYDNVYLSILNDNPYGLVKSDFNYSSGYRVYTQGMPHLNADSSFTAWQSREGYGSSEGTVSTVISFVEYARFEYSQYITYRGPIPSPSPTPIPTYATPTPTPQHVTQSHFQGFMIDLSTGTVVKDFDITPLVSDMFSYGDYYYLTIPVQYYFSEDDFPMTTTDELWEIELYDDGSDTGETSLKCTYLGSGLRHTNSFVQIPVHFDVNYATPTPPPHIYPWDSDGYFDKPIGDHSYLVPNKIGLDSLNQFDVSQFSGPFNKVITYCMSTSFNLLWFLWLIPICVIIGFFIKNR